MKPHQKHPTITVIDGGFGSQLSCHLGEEVVDGHPLWSSRFLETHPEVVIDTHLDFLRAGANLILTNTYQASIPGFMTYLNLSQEEATNLFYKAVDIAKQARDIFLDEFPDVEIRPLVVGSVGPYGAHLHDASEFHGDYADTTSVEIMREWHRPHIAALVDAGVDLLALETIPCQEEAEMLVELIKEFRPVKAWLSFSCKDSQSIAHGEAFQKVAIKCWDINPEQLVAIGVNCLRPSNVKNLIAGINKGRDNNKIPLIVYPNSGENYNPNFGWIDRDKLEPVEKFVQEWLDLGVTYVGGCCRTYAADVSRIRHEVLKWTAKKYGYTLSN